MREDNLYQYLSDGVFDLLFDTFADPKEPSYWNPLDHQLFFTEFVEYCQELLEHLSDTDFLEGFSGDDLDDARAFCDGLSVRIVADKLGRLPEVDVPQISTRFWRAFLLP